MNRSGPSLLHAGDNEIDAIDFSPADEIARLLVFIRHEESLARISKIDILRQTASQALMGSMGDAVHSDNFGFDDLPWLFTCDSRNRGLIRQGFDEAALLWKAVKATSGNILEIGRNLAGSTVLLAAASERHREIYSIDNRSNENPACKNFLEKDENKVRVHLFVADSRASLPELKFGFLLVDGDHTFEGVLADVLAHWNALQSQGTIPALAAFHDALPNENFKWRDTDRRLKRWSIRIKNKFRKKQQLEIAPAYEPGVLKVCEELIRQGLAVKWGSTASMLVLRKLADLPANFAELVAKS
ncbi:MAG TPA: class I SAM-dependent methyltransferase [Chthoniobacterales bacterium]|nr:class I SAM-dependent methyltransferase [Chthoniobacterales bacterium]